MAQLLQQLHAIEAEVAELLAKQDTAYEAFKQQFATRSSQLTKRRQELVSGKDPTAEELIGYERPGAGAAPPSSTGAKQSSKGGVPFFWLNVICNQDTLAQHVSSRDRRALEHLQDVRPIYTAGGVRGVELAFGADNPFFANRTLRRTLGDGSAAGSFGDGTAINWKDGCNLTVREVAGRKKKARKGGRGGKDAAAAGEGGAGGGEERKRFKGCPSFFRFFAPAAAAGGKLPDPTAPGYEDEDEGHVGEEGGSGVDARAAAKQARDEEIAAALLDEVVPKALHIFLSGPLQTSAGADSDADDDDDDYAMVDAASGGLEALPPRAQAALHALKANQASLDGLAREVEVQRLQLGRSTQEQLDKLYARRRAALLSPDGSQLLVPRFWLRALRALDSAALAITAADARLLAELVDVRFKLQLGPAEQREGQQTVERCGTLELEFLPSSSSWMKESVLRKHYTFAVPASGSALRILKSEASQPQWVNHSKDPTQKRGRDGRLRPAASFFCLFKPGAGKYTFGLTGDAKHTEAEAHDLEVELLLELQGALLPRATALYEAVTARGGDANDDEGSDASSSDEEPEEGAVHEEAGEGAAAGSAARAHAKKKASKGWHPSTSSMVLLGLMFMVLSAQLLVFFM